MLRLAHSLRLALAAAIALVFAAVYLLYYASQSSSSSTVVALSSTVDRDDSLLPSIPLAARQTRIDKWRHVQRTVDVASSRRIIAEHMALCRANDEAGLRSTISRNVSHGFVAFFAGGSTKVAAGHRRFFVALEVGDVGKRRRYCDVGAVIDFSLQSEDDKVDVDFALEVDGAPGLYELHPYFRRAGRYRLCMDLNAANPDARWRPTLENFDAPAMTNKSREWAVSLNRGHHPSAKAPRHCAFQLLRTKCFVARVHCGDGCVAAQRQLAERRRRGGLCGRAGTLGTLGTAFKSGAWMRLASCDGNLCVGDLHSAFPPDDDGSPDNYSRRASVNKTKWWVFVSDTCTVRLYSRAEAWRVLNRKWMMHWGGSTMQQPAIILLEYLLGVPVFEKLGFMEDAPLLPRALKLPSTAYRSFDRVAAEPTTATDAVRSPPPPPATVRATLSWGGCPNHHSMTQNSCKNASQGTEQRTWMRGILQGNFTTRRDFPAMALPSVLFVNHYWWRRPEANESAFMNQLAGVLTWMEATVAATLTQLAVNATGNASASFGDVPSVAAQRPLLIWVGPTRRAAESWVCYDQDENVFHRRMSWRIEAMLDRFQRGVLLNRTDAAATSSSSSAPRPFRDVVFMARAELTSPLHVGTDYAHGVHYGASRGTCHVLYSRRNHSVHCRDGMIMNITADVMLNHWWLGAIDGADSV